MRIGLIANTFDPIFGEKAGGHVHFFEIAKRWPNDDIWIFGPRSVRGMVRDELPNATFVAMPDLVRVGDYQLRYLVRALASVARIRQLRSCDVVLATSHFAPDVVPATLAHSRRFVVTIHHIVARARDRATNPLRASLGVWSQSFSFALIRRFARAVFVSELETARRIGIDPSRTATYLITHGVEQPGVELVPSPGLRRGAVFLGRLVPSKGVDDLLQAWRLVRNELPDVTLTVIGGGVDSYEHYLADLSKRLGVDDSVCFVGRLSDEQKIEVLRSAAVFAFPSKEEGFGIAIAEAMANGLPCVLYDLPPYRDAFTKGRLTAPVGDVVTFARLLVEVFRDNELRTRLSAEARELARSFSWEAAADVEHRALQDVLG